MVVEGITILLMLLCMSSIAGSTADVASLGLAAASAETGGPTNPVGGALSVGALVANRVSATFSGLSIPISLAVGNYRGAAANLAGLAVGTWGSKLTAKALGVAPLKGLKNDPARRAAQRRARARRLVRRRARGRTANDRVYRD